MISFSISSNIILLYQLPLSLLKTAQGHPMLVELKNGETYNGHLVNCDTWMNIHLREVICTSKVRSSLIAYLYLSTSANGRAAFGGPDGYSDGDRFWRMPECYIRGNTIKYLRVPDEVRWMVSVIMRQHNVICVEVPQVIDKVQEETKSRSDRKPPGVGRGRGRAREDGTSGGRDGGAKGMGGGRGRGGRTGGGRGGSRGR
ncbi:hypothetical protein OSB04_023058 [Centaurea solstitialis]|uniref:U6 snRNA-associated Sm-like protein LSm4 n=1 Tax=Centaurea solstitialis TaxID=347529 RepID=A0AA38WCI8_9ASTR|nr:hypothetical protein OSB04_023058 [Centaurea solstitialis]